MTDMRTNGMFKRSDSKSLSVRVMVGKGFKLDSYMVSVITTSRTKNTIEVN